MKPLHQLLFCLCFAFFWNTHLFAQKKEKVIFIELQLKDGSRIKGKQISLLRDTVMLETLDQVERSIPISSINRMRRVSAPRSKKVANLEWLKAPNKSRNIYSNTGYGLERGEGYYQNIWAFYNNFQFGISDYFSLGIQFETATTFVSLTDDFTDFVFPAYMIQPKFSIPIATDKLNLGIGAQIVGIPETGRPFDFAVINGSMTLGNPDRNVTGGIAVGFVDGRFTPIAGISIAGAWRLGNQFALVTDNFVFFDRSGAEILIFAIGLQTTGKKGTSWDFSFVGGGDEFGIWPSPIPLIGLKVPFKM